MYNIIPVGGIMVTPRPGPHTDNLKPGAAMRPFYGVEVALMDPDIKVRWNVLTIYNYS